MSQNFDDLIARLEVVFRAKDAGDPEYIEMTGKLAELTMVDRQLLLTKLNLRPGSKELRDKVTELFQQDAELEPMPGPPAPCCEPAREEACLAGDPTTDPDGEA